MLNAVMEWEALHPEGVRILIAKVWLCESPKDVRSLWLAPDAPVDTVVCSCRRGVVSDTDELKPYFDNSITCWHIRALFGAKDVMVGDADRFRAGGVTHLTYPHDFEIDFTPFGMDHFAWRLAARAMLP